MIGENTVAVDVATFDPTGQWILTVECNEKNSVDWCVRHSVNLWDTQGKLLYTVDNHWVEWAAFRPDGAQIVTAGCDTFDTVTGTRLRERRRLAVACLPGHRRDAYRGQNSRWPNLDGSRVPAIPGAGAMPMTNQVFLSYSEANRDQVESLAPRLHRDARLLFWFALWHSVPDRPHRLDPAGQTIVTASANQTAYIWDTNIRIFLTKLSALSSATNRC